MKKKAIALLLFALSFLFVLGNGARVGFCPCHHEFFLTACTCDQGCDEHGTKLQATSLAHHHREAPASGQEGVKPAASLAHHHREAPASGQEGAKPASLVLSDHEDGCENVVATFPSLVFEFGQASCLLSVDTVAVMADVLSGAPDFCLLGQTVLLEGERAPPLWQKSLYLGYMSPALL